MTRPASERLRSPRPPPEYLTTAEAAVLTLEALRAEGGARVGPALRYPRDTIRLPSGEGVERGAPCLI